MKKRENIINNLNFIFMTKKLSKAVEKENMPKIQKSKVEPLFTLVKQEDKVLIAIGNYLISKEKFKSFEEADEYIFSKPYEILINVASFVADQIINENKKTNEIKKYV